MELDELLQEGIRLEASDVHLTVGIEPMLRINGRLRKLGEEKISPEQINALVEGMMDGKRKEEFEEKGEVDFAYHLDDYRFRVNAFHQRGHAAAVLRIIPNEIMNLGDLGLPEKLEELALKPRGLFLVTGPTGSGKSTTLAAMIDLINENEDRHIITLEDPIEYVHQHKESIVNQREVGSDTENFANGLRAALRQDPDVILVGEMRDLDTISTAITAAETGHLVLSTVHTIGAANSIERIVDVFPSYQQEQIKVQLASVLKGVITQQIMPKAYEDGRTVAFEIMRSTPAIQNLIREGKTHQIDTILQTKSDLGMRTMDSSLINMYKNGEITKDTVLKYAVDRKNTKKRIKFM